MAPGKPKSVKPPALPPPVATPTKILLEAARAGEAEGRRLRRRTGRRSTRLTRPELTAVPAKVARAGLRTTLG